MICLKYENIFLDNMFMIVYILKTKELFVERNKL
jgi:hypothetical protein